MLRHIRMEELEKAYNMNYLQKRQSKIKKQELNKQKCFYFCKPPNIAHRPT